MANFSPDTLPQDIPLPDSPHPEELHYLEQETTANAPLLGRDEAVPNTYTPAEVAPPQWSAAAEIEGWPEGGDFYNTFANPT